MVTCKQTTALWLLRHLIAQLNFANAFNAINADINFI